MPLRKIAASLAENPGFSCVWVLAVVKYYTGLWHRCWLYVHCSLAFSMVPSEKLKGALDAGEAAQYHVPWCPREQTKGIFVVAPHPGAGFTARPTKRSDHATVPRLRERSFSRDSSPPDVSEAERFEVFPPQSLSSSFI